MVKRIILEIILIVITVLVVVCGYFLILDIESNAPQELQDKVEITTKEFMERKLFEIAPKNKDEKNNKTILYFHGGAYVAEATEELLMT